MVREAARRANVHVSTVYRWRDQYPEFAERWGEARAVVVGDLEKEAYKRALNGSDRMLCFLLSSLAPDKYGKGVRGEQDNGATMADLAAAVREWI